MRRVTDQVILVTGSTDGLGKAVAKELAAGGATVLVHGRDRARVERTVEEISRATGSPRLRSYLADFASLAQARQLADAVKADCERLDVLVNNAGIGGPRRRQESQDEYELVFAVNYLAPFLLTQLVLPLLLQSAPARVVNVASAGQAPLEFDDLMLVRRYDPWRAYAQSKLAQIMFTFELAGRLQERGQSGVTINALHPASLMPTKMVFAMFGRSPGRLEEGVESTLHLVLSPDLWGVTGRYFDRGQEARAHAQAYSAEARRILWETSLQLCARAGIPLAC